MKDHINGNLNGERKALDMLDVPMGTARPLRVVFIGMGISGISFAREAGEQLKNVEFAIYEKNVRAKLTLGHKPLLLIYFLWYRRKLEAHGLRIGKSHRNRRNKMTDE